MSAAALECGVTSAATEEADQRGGKHDQREGHVDHSDLLVLDRATMKPSASLTLRRDEYIGDYWWVNDERLVISFARSEEHTSELQSLMRSSYAVFCLTKKQSTGQDCNHGGAARSHNESANDSTSINTTKLACTAM